MPKEIWGSFSDVKINVTNLLGEEIYFKNSEFKFPLSLDISMQPKGIYLVKIQNGGEFSVQKIVYQ